ncbi:MAG TPA: FAD-dependent monooxygenase, partial [Burkholderiaceae bacterium]|nr:FAD-dependent monooxygenase [Burkholderiaceae bacterium]
MSSAVAPPRIVIVGGGIGGLAAALFLRRVGVDATVYEQAGALREVGAGLVVPPNLVRPLLRLGLGSALERVAVRLEAAWEFRRWQDGRVLFEQPMGSVCRALYGTDCYVAHRADLLQLLQHALPAPQLKLDHRCIAVSMRADGVQLRFARRDGPDVVVEADAAIGADGIHSVLRAAVAPDEHARFSGLCAFRCLVNAAQAPPMALRPVQTLWLGAGRHFVHYPISAGRLVNVVAIVPAGAWRDESWTADGDIAELSAQFAGWDERVQQLIVSASSTKRWAMYDRNPLERWSVGRVTLLGDAAHAMLPFFAQGAAQAIEDAFVLAACLRDADRASAPQALQRYEAIRRPRASQVQ